MHVSKVVTLTNTLSVLNYGLTKPLGSCVSVVACKTIVNTPDYCHRCRDRRSKPTAITQLRLVKKYETRRSGVRISVATFSEKMVTNGRGKLFRVPEKHFEIWIIKSECIKLYVLTSPKCTHIWKYSVPNSTHTTHIRN
jgi:hypothetical protein